MSIGTVTVVPARTCPAAVKVRVLGFRIPAETVTVTLGAATLTEMLAGLTIAKPDGWNVTVAVPWAKPVAVALSSTLPVAASPCT